MRCTSIDKVRKFTKYLLPDMKPIRGMPKVEQTPPASPEPEKKANTTRRPPNTDTSRRTGQTSRHRSTTQRRPESNKRRDRSPERQVSAMQLQRQRSTSMRRAGMSFSDVTRSTSTTRRQNTVVPKGMKPLSIQDLKHQDPLSFTCLTNTDKNIPFIRTNSDNEDVSEKRRATTPAGREEKKRRVDLVTNTTTTANTTTDETLSASQEDALLNTSTALSFDLNASTSTVTFQDTVSEDTKVGEATSLLVTVENTDIDTPDRMANTEQMDVSMIGIEETANTVTNPTSTPPIQTSEQKPEEGATSTQSEETEMDVTQSTLVGSDNPVSTKANTPEKFPDLAKPVTRPKKNVQIQDPPKSPRASRRTANTNREGEIDWQAVHNIRMPVLSTSILTSPYVHLDSLINLPSKFTELGTLIVSAGLCRTLAETRYTVASTGPLSCGVYAVINWNGNPVCYATVTLHPCNPRWDEYSERFGQFNPFNYPTYAVMSDYRSKPAAGSHILCISIKLHPGEYRLIDNVSRQLTNLQRITIRDHNSTFGRAMPVEKKRGG